MPLKKMFSIIAGVFALLTGVFAYDAPLRMMFQAVAVMYLLIATSAFLGILHYVDCLCADTEESK